MPLNLNALNPQQQIMLAMLLRQGPQGLMGGGMQQPTMGMPPGITPQQALMQQRLNPPPTLQQILTRLTQGQQGLQEGIQQLSAANQPNPLLQQLNPQLQAILAALQGRNVPGMGVPQSSGVTSA